MSEWRSPPIMSPEEEKQRRAIVAALGKGKSKNNPLSYYLGPLADTLNDAGRFAWAMSPGDDYQFSAEGFERMLGADSGLVDRLSGLGQGVAGAAMFAAPAVSAGLLDDATRMALDTAAQTRPMRAIGDFVDDEAGAIRVYHGSPHDFDRFSMDKIGTGEGAQAYGHGLYFAESEDVARGYRDQLSRGYLRTADGANVAEEYGADVADIFERTGGDPQDLKDTVARLRGLVDQNLAEFGVSSVSELKPMFEGDLASTVIEFSDRADRLERLISGGNVEFFDPGRMYEVNINANPEDFLDWDAPLSMQGAKVQEYFNHRMEKVMPGRDRWDPDGDILAKLASPQSDLDGRDWLRTGPLEWASSQMREAGIPGIKYLDQGSRGAGDGTRNYVVFDDSLIEILKKYGVVPGMVGGSALADQYGPPSQADTRTLREYLGR